jgi:hypothetical protein
MKVLNCVLKAFPGINSKSWKLEPDKHLHTLWLHDEVTKRVRDIQIPEGFYTCVF